MKKIFAAFTMVAFAASLALAAPQEQPKPANGKSAKKMSCCSTASSSKECKEQMAKGADKEDCAPETKETQSKASNESTGSGTTSAGVTKNPN